jgi:hypothetical protein
MKRLLDVLEPYVDEGAKIMLLLFFSLALVIFAISAIMGVFHRFPLDYGEAPLVDQAMRLGSGENIYRQDLTSPPYTISNYPPLYVLTLVPFVKIFGASFFPGRLISVLSTIAAAIFLNLIIKIFTKDRLAAIISTFLFLSVPYVVGWSTLLRVDMFALGLSLAGLYVLVRDPINKRDLLISALLLVAAIYTRQSYALAAPFAAFVWLWTKDQRRAVSLAAIVVGTSLVLFFILNILTRGGFYFNIVTANVNQFDLDRLTNWLKTIWRTAPILLIIGAVFLLLAPKRFRSWPLLAPYLLGAFLAALTIGKIGSNINYLLEFFAALCFATGAFIAWSSERRWLRILILILLTMQTGQFIQTSLNEPIESLKWRLKPGKELDDLEWIVNTADDQVLADEFMGMITLQDKPLYLQPFEMTQLANAGLWDQTALLERIQNRDFSIILIHHFMQYPVYKERWTPEMLESITENYQPTDFLADTVVYKPRDSQDIEAIAVSACPGAPWQLPTRGDLGMWWISYQLNFMGEGYENSEPVYAVADGLLMRGQDWNDAVAIQHDDPLNPGEYVWSFYGDMSSAIGESFVSQEFPTNSAGVPVKSGQLLGYQGMWSGSPGMPIWAHLRFAVVEAQDDGTFPSGFMGLANASEPQSNQVQTRVTMDPSPYLGTVRSRIMGEPAWLPPVCNEDNP